ncbi:MAG: hypothetical protein JWP63_5210 [Candidatus Solibacter sp.]|nr:hypothetical protein [Candidatus Solibacter sp.]
MTTAQLHPRRHVFRGYSTGVSAHIRRPEKYLVKVQGSSSLPPTGGHHESNVEAKQHNKYLSHGPITTSAYGDYADAQAAIDTTYGRVAFDAVPTETRVTASVQDLEVLGRVRIGLAAMGLNARCAHGSDEPVIVPEGCHLNNVSIDGSRLKITLAEDLFRECNTLTKLAEKHAALPEDHKCMFLPANAEANAEANDATGFPIAKGAVRCTIVKKIEWEGAPVPKVEIHGHVVYIPDFGKVYFGEMFITGHSRRLSMVRFQLGSPDGGEIVAADGDVPGSTFPPT